MENTINIAEILKDCPEGIKLYSPVYGDVVFQCVEERKDKRGGKLLIKCLPHNSDEYPPDWKLIFSNEGKYSEEGECVLFPSKEQKDWTKFEKPLQVEVVYPEKVYWFEYNHKHGLALYDKMFDLVGDYELVEGVQEGQIVYNIGKKIKTINKEEYKYLVKGLELFGVQLKIKE